MTSIQFPTQSPRSARLSLAHVGTGGTGLQTRTMHELPEEIRVNKRLRDDRLRQMGLSPRQTTISARQFAFSMKRQAVRQVRAIGAGALKPRSCTRLGSVGNDHSPSSSALHRNQGNDNRSRRKGRSTMNLLLKNAITSRIIAALVLLTSLTTSAAAHASSAFLSRAINHAGAPVIEAGLVPSKKIVTLEAFIEPGSNYSLHLVSASGDSTDPFVVPSGQSFVITSVEITPFSNNAALAPNYVYLLGQDPFVVYELWLVSNQVSTSFQYPTGILLESGSTPWVSAQLMCDIFVHGYLTPA